MGTPAYTEEEFQKMLKGLFLEKKKVKELQKKIQDIGQERNALAAQIESLLQEKQSSDKNQDLVLQSTLHEKEAALTQLKQHLDDVRARFNERKKQLDDAHIENEKLKKQAGDTDKLKKLVLALKTKCEELQGDSKKGREAALQLSDFETKLSLAKLGGQKLQTELSRLQAREKELIAETNRRDEIIAKLKTELTKAEYHLDAEKANVDSLQEQLSEQSRRSAQAEDRLSATTGELEHAKAEAKQLRRQVEIVQETSKQLQRTIEQYKNAQGNKVSDALVTGEVLQLKTDLRLHQERLKIQEADNKRLEAELAQATLAREQAEKTATIKERKDEVLTGISDKLQEKLETVTLQLQDAQKEKERLTSTLSFEKENAQRLKERFDDSQNDMKQLRIQVNKYKSEESQRETFAQSVQSAQSKIHDDLKAVEQEKQSLKTRTAEMSHELRQKDAQIMALQAELKALHKEMGEELSSVQQNAQAIAQAKSKLDSALAEKDSRVKDQTERQGRLEKLVRLMQRQRVAQQEEIAKLQNELKIASSSKEAELQKEIEKSSAALKRAQERLEHLLREIEAKDKRIRVLQEFEQSYAKAHEREAELERLLASEQQTRQHQLTLAERLQGELQHAKIALQMAEQELKKMRTQQELFKRSFDDTQKKLGESGDIIQTLNTALDRKVQDYREIEEELFAKRDAFTKAVADLEDVREKNKKLADAVRAQSSQFEKAKKVLRSSDEKRKALLREVIRLKELDKELSLVKEGLVRGMREAKESEHLYLEVINEKVALLQEMHRLKNELQDRTERFHRLENSESLAHEERTQLSREMSELKASKETLEVAQRELQEKHRLLAEQKHVFEHSFNELKKEHKNLLDEMGAREAAAAQARKEFEKRLEEGRLEINKARSHIESMAKAERDLSEHAQQLNTQVHEKEKFSRLAQAHLAKKVKENTQLRDMFEKQKTQAQEIYDQLQLLRQHSAQLENRLELQKRHEDELKTLVQERTQLAEKSVKEWEGKYFSLNDKWQKSQLQLQELQKVEKEYAKLYALLANIKQYMGLPGLNQGSLSAQLPTMMPPPSLNTAPVESERKAEPSVLTHSAESAHGDLDLFEMQGPVKSSFKGLQGDLF